MCRTLSPLPCETTGKLCISSSNSLRVSFAGFHRADGDFVVYRLLVQEGEKFWRVAHRFSEFCDLHAQLKQHGITLPSPPCRFSLRKGVGKLATAVFCMRRQAQLQEYMSKLLELQHGLGEGETTLLNFLGVDFSTCNTGLSSVPEEEST